MQDQLRLGRFQALVGLCYERYTDLAGYKTAQETAVNQHAFLPRAGLVSTLNDHVNLYGTYVQGYNPKRLRPSPTLTRACHLIH